MVREYRRPFSGAGWHALACVGMQDSGKHGDASDAMPLCRFRGAEVGRNGPQAAPLNEQPTLQT